MNVNGNWLALFLAGTTGIWKGIGLGLVIQSNPFEVGTFTALGSIISVLVLYFIGEKPRKWIIKTLFSNQLYKRKGKIQKIVQKYGSFGLGLLAPGPFGPFIPLLLGMMLLDNTKKFVAYLIIGIIIWSYLFAFFFHKIAALVIQVQ